MNSKLKGIIVCGVFVLCLGVVALILTLTNKDDDTENNNPSDSKTPAVSQEATPLIDFDKEQVKSIAVSNQYGNLNIVKNGDEWLITELDGIEQNTTITGAAANIAATLSYLDVVEENASDLSKYGLDEPTSTFTTEFLDYDRTVKTFHIGNMSPKQDYYYVCEEGNSTVYTVYGTGLAYFLNPAEYLANPTLLETPEDTTNWPAINDLTVKRSDWDYEVKFKEAEESESLVSTQIMYEPIVMPLNITTSSEVTHGMWGLAADEAVKAAPSDEDMKKYGLDNPFTVVTLETDSGEAYELKIGNPIYYFDESGNQTQKVARYYTYITGVDGKDVIYAVSVDKLLWATFNIEDVISSLMTSNNINTVKSVEIESDATVYDFELTGEGETSPSKVTLDEKEVSVDLFKDLYQQIITCPTNEAYFEETENKPYLTISIKLKDGGEDKLEIVTDTDRRSVVFVNGRPQFRISSAWSELLLENIQNVKDGKAVKEFV